MNVQYLKKPVCNEQGKELFLELCQTYPSKLSLKIICQRLFKNRLWGLLSLNMMDFKLNLKQNYLLVRAEQKLSPTYVNCEWKTFGKE